MTSQEVQLVIRAGGIIRCVYGEQLDLMSFGVLSIARASHVEPDPLGNWLADLSPVDGPLLGPFERRSEALRAELEWLNAYWLSARS